MLLGVGLFVYNILGFLPVGDHQILWDHEQRLGAAWGAVLFLGGFLLRRVK